MREFPPLPKDSRYETLSGEQRQFVEEYLCNRTSVAYMQENLYDSIGTEAYVDRFKFRFNCELLPIANDEIRVHYLVPVEDPLYMADYHNSLGRDYSGPEKNLT